MWNIYLLFNWIAQSTCGNIGLVDMYIYIYMCTATDYWLFGWRSKYNFWASLQHEAVKRKGKPHRFIGDRDIYIKKKIKYEIIFKQKQMADINESAWF